MKQANDFLEETKTLHKLISGLNENEFDKTTLFKEWTINDILVHLHFWNRAADLSLNKPDEFAEMIKEFFSAVQTGKLRPHENRVIAERGYALMDAWLDLSDKLANDYSRADPKQRLQWAGANMSALTCISARQMEVWAHGQAVFDLLGEDRKEHDRIRNIVILGINAFGWTHEVHSLEKPEVMPFLKLLAPSGEEWSFGEESKTQCIKGSAVDFAKVVTQTRNVVDTHLVITGKDAKQWMAHAQCFAGPPEMPPAPGLRKKS
jgi:uncharacterized protein (TIGR03084 family)